MAIVGDILEQQLPDSDVDSLALCSSGFTPVCSWRLDVDVYAAHAICQR